MNTIFYSVRVAHRGTRNAYSVLIHGTADRVREPSASNEHVLIIARDTFNLPLVAGILLGDPTARVELRLRNNVPLNRVIFSVLTPTARGHDPSARDQEFHRQEKRPRSLFRRCRRKRIRSPDDQLFIRVLLK